MTRSRSPPWPAEVERASKRVRQSTSSDSSKTFYQQDVYDKDEDVPPPSSPLPYKLDPLEAPVDEPQPQPQPLQLAPVSSSEPVPGQPPLSRTLPSNQPSPTDSPDNTLSSTSSIESIINTGEATGEFEHRKDLEEALIHREDLEERAGARESEAEGPEEAEAGESIEERSGTESIDESDVQSRDSEGIMVGTPLQIRAMLNSRWLFINDAEAEKTMGAGVIAKAMGILDQRRGSDWSQDKRLQVTESIQDYAEENEATFVINLMEHLLGKSRSIPKEAHLTREQLEDHHQWIEAEWKKDHLRARWNSDFLPDCMPEIRTGSDFHDKLVSQVPRIEKPRPNLAWGIYETAFSLHHRQILNSQKNNLAGPHLYDVFFAIEAKCMNASIAEAENQCMRTGCAMVSTRRSLNRAATSSRNATVGSPPSATAASGTLAPSLPPAPRPSSASPRADGHSFAFTMAVAPGNARMFVNWALVLREPDSIKWHMHLLREYSFRRPDELNDLHHNIDNVLDWGVKSRKRRVVERCENIKEMQAVGKGGVDSQEAEARRLMKGLAGNNLFNRADFPCF